MTVTTPAKDAKVSLTVSNQGVLASASDGSAVVRKEVTDRLPCIVPRHVP